MGLITFEIPMYFSIYKTSLVIIRLTPGCIVTPGGFYWCQFVVNLELSPLLARQSTLTNFLYSLDPQIMLEFMQLKSDT